MVGSVRSRSSVNKEGEEGGDLERVSVNPLIERKEVVTPKELMVGRGVSSTGVRFSPAAPVVLMKGSIKVDRGISSTGVSFSPLACPGPMKGLAKVDGGVSSTGVSCLPVSIGMVCSSPTAPNLPGPPQKPLLSSPEDRFAVTKERKIM